MAEEVTAETVEHNNQPQKKLKYPRSVFLILSNEFCERFCYYGMKTVLGLYLTTVLHYDDDTSTVWYHIFNMLCYFFPLIGAIIADSCWGKYKTIVNLSILYSIGNIVLAVSAISVLSLPQRTFALLGLLFIAVGTGGIKPCISSFGGDQFVLPQQQRQLERFFSVFYFSINAGSLISTALTPILREDVKCFGEKSCFPLAFGVPGILMIISVCIFVAGTPLYKRQKPSGNIIVTVADCITNAIKNKILISSDTPRKQHWLDYSDSKYSNKEISDIKALLNVLFLFIPLPLFWALFDQQGSRWTFQAVHMDGRFVAGYNIKPDQMQVLNPLMILTFIPLFETCVYPILHILGIRRALQKMTLGGILAAVAFTMSAGLEFQLEKTYPVYPDQGNGQIRLFNSLNCDVFLKPDLGEIQHIPALSNQQILQYPVNNSTEEFRTTISVNSSCPIRLGSLDVNITVTAEKAVSGIISLDNTNNIALISSFDNLEKDPNSLAKIRLFYTSNSASSAVVNLIQNSQNQMNISITNNELTNFTSVAFGSYTMYVNGRKINMTVNFEPGSIDTILINNLSNVTTAALIDMVPPNSIHILWQLPQIIVITAAEILFSITGLEFSFTQAPSSMKAVLSSAWLLTVAFGNLIVVIVSEIKIFRSQAYEFLLFAGLMLLDMCIFIIMAINYKYVDFSTSEQELVQEQNQNEEQEQDQEQKQVQQQEQEQKIAKEDTAL